MSLVFPWGQPRDPSALPTVADTATRSVRAAIEISGCEAAAIFWYDGAGDVLVPLAISEPLGGLSIPIVHPGQGLTGASFASQQPIYLERGYETSPYAHNFGRLLAIEAMSAVPLRFGSSSLGVLVGFATEPHAFPAKMRDAIETMAADIVPAFGVMGGILVEAQINRAEYALVSSLIREYASDADFDATCARIASVAMTLLGSDYAIIGRREPNLSYSYHGAQATRSDLWADGMSAPLPWSRAADGLLDSGDVVVISVDELSRQESGFEHSRDEGARTVMIVPIALNRHRIGLLVVGWRIDVSVSERLRHLAETLAGHAAIVIAESQRLHIFAATAVDARRSDDTVARRLTEALAAGDLHLEYQPIFDARTGTVVSIEALCRWPSAPDGFERPDRFILFAEDRGLIGSLTDYVIDLAAREWKAVVHLPISLAVNVSMRTFEEPAFAERTLAKLARYKIVPHRFGIELTETTQLHDRKHAASAVRKLVTAGVRVSIDDFGEGYAALSYLKTFRASALKIDRRFVTNIAEDAYDYSIVRSVTELAHSLGVAVIAEGIESQAALAIVTGLGCDMVQGYQCARPMSMERLRAFLS